MWFIPAGAGNAVSRSAFSSRPFGLSPLARGTPDVFVFDFHCSRFIPAGAENTFLPQITSRRFSVYPRWRGERQHFSKVTDRASGLSPLARGILRQLRCARPPRRFIPAGAGNTHIGLRFLITPTVYPRWRGEHARFEEKHPDQRGLSPLARGTPNRDLFVAEVLRFIPAGAGNTVATLHPTFPSSVYPRWRGEHAISCFAARNPGGLSPLARGTRASTLRQGDSERFIPAGAGNTMTPRRSLPALAVYPRWRGEHTKAI